MPRIIAPPFGRNARIPTRSRQGIVEFVALPLKPEGGDGDPARITATER